VTRAARRSRSVAALRGRQNIGSPLTRTPVHVHIDNVVLFGFSTGSARRIADGLSAELDGLFSRSGVPVPMMLAHAAPRLDAGTVRTASNTAATTIGRQVANAVYRVARP
jgi:hypothetical protein